MKMINKILCENCLILLPLIPDNKIEACLTDPPYNINLKYDKYKDKKPKDQFWLWIEDIFTHIHRVLKPKAHLTFTCSQKQIWIYRPLLENLGFTFRHLGIWHNPKRKAGSYPGQWPYAWEAIMDFTKDIDKKGVGFKKLNNSNSVGYMDVWIEEEPKGIKHPAKRPVQCWEDLLLLISNENDIVLDPFLGSGTTALVSKRNNRRYIGIDISEEYCEIARSRLNDNTRTTKFEIVSA